MLPGFVSSLDERPYAALIFSFQGIKVTGAVFAILKNLSQVRILNWLLDGRKRMANKCIITVFI